jgi:cytochrome c-type biogenesis protein CcmE
MAKGVKNRWIVAVFVLVGAVTGLSFVSMDKNSVYFYTPSEAKAGAAELSSDLIKVGGMVMPGSVTWKAETLSLSFTLTDLKGTDIKVNYSGTPPDMFKEGQGVVCEGTIAPDGTGLIARHLLVKHSEEYKPPHAGGDSKEKELLEKSLFKE